MAESASTSSTYPSTEVSEEDSPNHNNLQWRNDSNSSSLPPPQSAAQVGDGPELRTLRGRDGCEDSQFRAMMVDQMRATSGRTHPNQRKSVSWPLTDSGISSIDSSHMPSFHEFQNSLTERASAAYLSATDSTIHQADNSTLSADNTIISSANSTLSADNTITGISSVNSTLPADNSTLSCEDKKRIEELEAELRDTKKLVVEMASENEQKERRMVEMESDIKHLQQVHGRDRIQTPCDSDSDTVSDSVSLSVTHL